MARSRTRPEPLGSESLTQPDSPRWVDRPARYRDFESAFFVGHGRETFERCAEELLHWEVKIRSGFDIDIDRGADDGAEGGRRDGGRGGAGRVAAGQEPTIFVRLGPFRLPEPARVIAVFETENRRGFTYGTKPGHPITGEESFILIHTADDRVFLVLRSVSRPGFGIWRLGEPFVRIAQIVYRRRYARALR